MVQDERFVQCEMTLSLYRERRIESNRDIAPLTVASYEGSEHNDDELQAVPYPLYTLIRPLNGLAGRLRTPDGEPSTFQFMVVATFAIGIHT